MTSPFGGSPMAHNLSHRGAAEAAKGTPMIQSGLKKLVECFGPDTVLSWARWAPSSDDTQTLTEAHGVSSITRTGSLAELIVLANELRTDYTAHLAQKAHAVNDTANVNASPTATNEATAITMANAIKAAYNLHLAEATVHTVDDTVNDVTASDATDEASLVTLVNEIKADFNLHRVEATVHDVDDDKNVVATANATDTATAVTLINAIKAAYNLHLAQHVHKVPDVTNVLTAPASSNLATAITLLNELRTAYAAHRVSTTHHDNADSTNTVASGACTDRATAVTLANQLKTAYAAHRTQATRHPTNDDLNNVSAVLNVTGAYRINLKQKGGYHFPVLGYIDNGTTLYYFLDTTETDPDAGTVDVRLRSVAFASVASGPAHTDTIDELQALIFQPSQLTVRSGAKSELSCFGPKAEFAYARWAPSADDAQTLTEAQGIKTIARTGAGAYTVTMSSGCEAMLVLIAYVDNGTTLYHFPEVLATNAAAGTFTTRHRSVAFASVASGPSASDTVDQIEVLVLKRMAT